ncbi:MAG TPA: flagellar biosynthesis anti-sigma factor FlgM [Terriglobia bacterium]|nr:flagellar biosynthesis anti-sigma factor FlgM [Terriglobia bacterium]
MKIDSNLLFPHDRSAERIGASASAAPGKAREALPSCCDEVRLSADRESIEALKSRLKEVPEVRWERVAALRQAVQSGTYHVSDQQLADAMLQDLLPAGL